MKRETGTISPAALGQIPQGAIAPTAVQSDTKRRNLPVECSATKREYPRNKCVHQLFEEQVDRTPDAVALVFKDGKLTYAELNARANQLAHYLRGVGVGPESLVGLYVERSLEMVVALLGILKAGGAYVPLDPAYPRERLAFMLEDTMAPVLLTQQRLLAGLPQHSARVVCLDSDWPEIELQSRQNPLSPAGPENLAYVIYTSGSTGKAKGVAIEHRSTAALIHWALEVFTPDEMCGVLASTSICFDLSVYELFVTLSAGGRIILVENALALLSLSPQADVRLINTVPSAIAELLRLNAIPESVVTVNLAGEPLSTDLVGAIYRRTCARRVYDLYGPTEDTTYSTYTLRLPDAPATIGRPISNTQVYILDERREPVPVGVAGELYIGGDGLARGYLNRPELTAEKFLANPFAEPGSRLYRTGDLARYLPDGNIEFLGRIDHQVKIRGFRIELGEIESVLGQHPRVTQSVVLAREDTPGDKRLVAYVVASTEEAPGIDELRNFLKQKLPEYMVPAAFVMLTALPRTPNGKTDRKALPAPDMNRPALRDAYTAPRNPLEQLLADIFQELLNLDRVGIHDNFFDLGGHSLLAARVVSRVRHALKIEVALRALFEAPTVAELAERVRATEAGPLPLPIQPVPRNQPLPLSFAQLRLWFLYQYETNHAVYNIPLVIHLTGRLDVSALRLALKLLVERHEALRTTFQTVDGEPAQVISQDVEVDLPLVDLSERPDQDKQDKTRELVTDEATRPFNLSRGPLFRASLLRLSAREHVLLISMHHIVSDGWSMGIVFDELKAIYRSLCLREELRLPHLPVQYPDYAAWQRQWLAGVNPGKLLAFWKTQLAGAPAVTEMPTDRPRPATQSYRGACELLVLPRALSEALTTLSRREGVTLFMTLLAGLKILLHRYSRQDDIVVGSPIAGRNCSETENVIGLFVNTLVLRTDLSGTPTVRELLGRVRQIALGAYDHQDLPFEKLVETLNPQRSLSYSPLFQVMLVLQNAPQSQVEMPELEIVGEDVHGGTSKFDLTLSVEETVDGLKGVMEYSTDLFDAETIRRMLGHLRLLLEGMVADPGQRIGELPMLGEIERHRVLVEWNNTRRDYPRDKCVHQLFEEQVEKTPEAVAVEFGDKKLTYRELNAKANQLAHHLRTLGVGPEVLVGICVERSLEMIVGLLGILKAGAAYVPLDPSYPRDLLGFMLDDTKAPVLLTQQRLLASLPEHLAGVVCLDSNWPEIDPQSRENPASPAGPDNLAYVMYTSGSTGRPKGVEILHQSVLRLVCGMEYAEAGAGRVFLQLAPISFDASTFEIWAPLLHGAHCIIYPERVPVPAELGRVLSIHKVTTLWLTSSLYNTIIDEAPEALAGVEELLIGGEMLCPRHVRRGLELLAGTRIINGYGPTESTTFACCYRIPRALASELASIPIGRPISQRHLAAPYRPRAAQRGAGEIFLRTPARPGRMP